MDLCTKCNRREEAPVLWMYSKNFHVDHFGILTSGCFDHIYCSNFCQIVKYMIKRGETTKLFNYGTLSKVSKWEMHKLACS